jgi:hypothetical protein
MSQGRGQPRPAIGTIGEDGRYRIVRRGDSKADPLFNEPF